MIYTDNNLTLQKSKTWQEIIKGQKILNHVSEYWRENNQKQSLGHRTFKYLDSASNKLSGI